MNTPLLSPQAPAPIGPYSQAVASGSLIFLSGTIPIDPRSGEIVGETLALQARQVLLNIKAFLQGQGLGVNAIVKTTVFLRDMTCFAEFNKVYEEEMAGWKPARSVVEVSGLPKNALIEIEAVACR